MSSTTSLIEKSLGESRGFIRGGMCDDDTIEDVIDNCKKVDVHPELPDHYVIAADAWREIRRGRKNQLSDEWGASVHCAAMADGRWLCWNSKTENAPAYFEVKEEIPFR